VTLPQLARTMGCSSHAARWLRSRWERAGWACGRALLVGAPVFVWLTRRGQSLAGIEYSLWRPNAGMLAHIAAVTDVRLHVLDRHPGAVWVCERELHRELAIEPGGRQRHRPDGLVVIDGREVAVEVELTLKRRARIEQIMAELVARYGSVTYFVAPAARHPRWRSSTRGWARLRPPARTSRPPSTRWASPTAKAEWARRSGEWPSASTRPSGANPYVASRAGRWRSRRALAARPSGAGSPSPR